MLESKQKVKIVTHGSGFHTDDIFAVATLSLILEKNGEDFSITRSRNMEIAEKADYLVDFGGINDPKINRFDHHQEGGAGKRQNGIPYASFGLVWRTYGEKLCGTIDVANRVDEVLVQPIDGPDNGVQFIETKFDGLMPVDIQFFTQVFSPTWKEDASKVDDIFLSLVMYAKILINRVIIFSQDEIEGEKEVKKIYENSNDKRLIVLDNSKYPWERVLCKFSEPLYVVYRNINHETWSVKSIRDSAVDFKSRKNLPESWAGKRDEELEKITGVEGAVFCHNARFMAVAKTKEAILKMAEIALNS